MLFANKPNQLLHTFGVLFPRLPKQNVPHLCLIRGKGQHLKPFRSHRATVRTPRDHDPLTHSHMLDTLAELAVEIEHFRPKARAEAQLLKVLAGIQTDTPDQDGQRLKLLRHERRTAIQKAARDQQAKRFLR